MPNIRPSGAPAADQAMTIPERVKAALKAAGRFEVGSVVYLPDRDQTLRVVKLDFTSGKKGQKGVWLRWESECAECGKTYHFTTKRSFSYPTRTCPEHRKPGVRSPVVKDSPPSASAEVLHRAAVEVLNGFSLFDERVPITDAQHAVQRVVYGEVLRRGDPRSRGIWAALGEAMDSGAAPGVFGDEDILFCSPLP